MRTMELIGSFTDRLKSISCRRKVEAIHLSYLLSLNLDIKSLKPESFKGMLLNLKR